MEAKDRKKEVYIEIIFLSVLFIFLCMWAYIQPLNASPDELMRYQIPDYIFRNGRLPHGGDPIIRNSMWGISYAFTPILSYIFSAGFMKVTSFFTTDAFALLMAARLVSVLFGVGTAFFAIRISKKIFQKGYCICFVFLVVFLPQALFLTSYVNNDSMALFSTAFIVYMWIKGMETQWNYKVCVGLSVALSICFLSYYNAYGFILCSALLFVSTMIFKEKGKPDVKGMFKKGSLILAIVFLLTGWWFIRNFIIYHGDILGMATSDAYAQQYAIDSLKPSNRSTPLLEGRSLYQMFIEDGWLMGVYRTFIGGFGQANIFLDEWMYKLYTLFFGLGFIGVISHIPEIFRIKKKGEVQVVGFFNISMALALVIPNLLNVYYSYASDYQPQGRYSMPMLVPLMYFVVLGIQKLLDRFVKNEKVKQVILGFIASCIFLMGIYSYFGIFAPNY